MDPDTKLDRSGPIAAVVYNPVNVPVPALRAAVAAAEREHGWGSSHWFETARDDGGSAATRKAIAVSPAVVLAAGGDGTVRAVAEELHPTGIPLALLPSGTGNLLARNLHLTLDDLPRAVDTAFAGTERAVDIALAEYRTPDGAHHHRAFVVMAGIGLDAHMAANTNSALKKRIGWAAYADPIARSVLSGKRIHFRYRVDGGRTHALSAHTVIVGNCGTLTANILLLPDANFFRTFVVAARGEPNCPSPSRAFASTVSGMLTVIVILLVVWAILAVVGFAINGLLWLAIIGIILFVGTLIFGFVRRNARRKKSV
jgi:diacylglycerol kinase family enzyme